MNADNIVTGFTVLVKGGATVYAGRGVYFVILRPRVVTIAGRFGQSVAWRQKDGSLLSTHVENLKTIFAVN